MNTIFVSGKWQKQTKISQITETKIPPRNSAYLTGAKKECSLANS